MPAQRFRKKPVTIDAIQWTGDNTREVLSWIRETGTRDVLFHTSPNGEFEDYLAIKTLEGVMRGDVGDWIIRGLSGEHYPCKADIFEQSYESAADAADTEDAQAA